MINKVYQFTSKEFQGRGSEWGVKENGSLLTFFPLKDRAVLRNSAKLGNYKVPIELRET